MTAEALIYFTKPTLAFLPFSLFLFFSFYSLESSFFLSLFFFNKIFVWCWISIIDNITDLAHG
jgi:hypothetical protein